MPKLSGNIMLPGDPEMSSLILQIQLPGMEPGGKTHVYRSGVYLKDELPSSFPSFWLNEVGKSEKLIPAETLDPHSR